VTSPALAAALAGALGAAAPASQGPNTSVADLPGWASEDHAAAFRAFRQACGAARDAAMAKVCLAAQALPPLPEPAARAFFEDRFQADPATAAGVLTAYFAPLYEARHAPGGAFTAPLRGKPADLAATTPYPDRAAIEAGPALSALAWMRPEDLFFLQVQGSGVLTFEDGRRKKAVFAATNGARYVAIGGPMAKQGLLTGEISADAIHAWLARHRGPSADAVMRLNPRYVFFRLVKDDGRPPSGSAHVPLPPGRALAVDPAFHAMGELFWVDADKPIIAGAKASYRRLAMALDTGGAIRGAARADLFLGMGAAAGTEAGKVHHRLRLWRLVPR
jgi:membrane-bound lytic murein transglycosylase A